MKKKRENLTDSQIAKRIMLFYVGIVVFIVLCVIAFYLFLITCGFGTFTKTHKNPYVATAVESLPTENPVGYFFTA